MKYTLMGFNQEKVVSLCLDMTDLCILRWFIDFQNTKKMKHHYFQTLDTVMYQVNYDAVIEDLPILGLRNNDSVYRRFGKLVNAGLLKHETLRSGGTFAYYCVTEDAINLTYQQPNPTDEKPNPTDEKSEGYGWKVGGGTDGKSEQNNSSINYPSINPSIKKKEAKASKKKQEEELVIPEDLSMDIQDVLCDWLEYKRDGKRKQPYKPIGWKNQLKLIRDALDTHGEKSVVNQISTAIANHWQGMNLQNIKTTSQHKPTSLSDIEKQRILDLAAGKGGMLG